MTGFWVKPGVRESGWECLYNMYPSHKGAQKGIYAMDFLHGYCTYFARTLHNVLGYEMLAVYDPAEEWSDDDKDSEFIYEVAKEIVLAWKDKHIDINPTEM